MSNKLNQKHKYWAKEMEKAQAKNDVKRINLCTEKIQQIEYLQGY